MSVTFKEVAFKNTTGIDQSVNIEAPIRKSVVTGYSVGPNKTVNIPVNVDNCDSVAVIVAGDDDHDETKQAFAVNSPGGGFAIYLESVAVSFTIGSLTGSLKARTG